MPTTRRRTAIALSSLALVVPLLLTPVASASASEPECTMEFAMPNAGTQTLTWLRPSSYLDPDNNDYRITTTLRWDTQEQLKCFDGRFIDWAYEHAMTYQQDVPSRKIWNVQTDIPDNAGFYLDTPSQDRGEVTGFDFGIFRPERLTAGQTYTVSFELMLPQRPIAGNHLIYVTSQVAAKECSPMPGQDADPWCVGLRASSDKVVDLGGRDEIALVGVGEGGSDRTWSVTGSTCWRWNKNQAPVRCDPASGQVLADPTTEPDQAAATLAQNPDPATTTGFNVEDSYLGGTWARTDPWDGTWYSQAARPGNAAYWYPSGLGVGVDCATSAAAYPVHFLDGHQETWSTWLHVTDGKWIPAAATNQIYSDGLNGLPQC